jgi:hypothetical protein
MKKQNLWARVRNVFNPDENNGLTQTEIDVLNKLKDKKEFQDLMFEPLQMYSLMVEKHGEEEVMLWLAEFINQEIDANLKSVASFFYSLSQVSGRHNLGYAFQLSQMMGFGFEIKSEMEEEVEKIEEAQKVVPKEEPKESPQETPKVLPKQERPEPKPKAKLPWDGKYSYQHPMAKGKMYSTKLFQDVWELLPESFTRQSALMLLQENNIGSSAFLHRIINECTKDGFLIKPHSGYYEKNIERKNQRVEAEASIEIEEPVQYKIVEEKEKTPVRKLEAVYYNREDGNNTYENEDWILLDNAQVKFGLNKKYLINLVNYCHLKTVGKTLINGKWTCVVNYGELNNFCNYKEKVAAKDGHRKQCQSCNNEFNAWNDNVNICRSCMSGV